MSLLNHVFLFCAVVGWATSVAARILVIGDSNATGTGIATVTDIWTVQVELARNELVQVWGAPGAFLAVNYPAASGEELGFGYHPFCASLAGGVFKVEYAILALGSNDAESPAFSAPDDSYPCAAASPPCGNAYDATRALLQSLSTRWLCVLPPPMRPASRDAGLAPYREAIRRACIAAGAAVLDPTEFMDPATDLLADGGHLSVSGHTKLAAAVLTALPHLTSGTPTPTASETPSATATAPATATAAPTTPVASAPGMEETATDTPTLTPTATAEPTEPTPDVHAAVCGSVPRAGCESAIKAKLKIRNDANDSRDALLFSFSGRGTAPPSALGDPTAMTSYAFCVYDDSGLKGSAAIAPGGGWSANARGIAFADPDGAQGGITRLKLQRAAAGKTKLLLKSAGPAQPELIDVAMAGTVVAQLVSAEDACWDSAFPVADASSTRVYRAKS